MKYITSINQKRALELKIENINQAHIFDLLSCSQVWAKTEVIGEEVFYWVARQRICDELPILNLKPDTVYRHLKSLRDLELINYKKLGKKDLIQITKLGKSYYVGNRSELTKKPEIDPSKSGNRSEFYSEIDPTYKDTNIINNTNYNNKKTNKKENHETQILENEKEFESMWEYMFEEYKKLSKSIGTKSKAKDLFLKQVKKTGLHELKFSIYNYVLDCSLRGYGFKHLSSFLSLSQTYVDEWKNGTENHKALLELKETPNKHQNNGARFESKSERIERDVFENREKIIASISNPEEEIDLPWLKEEEPTVRRLT